MEGTGGAHRFAAERRAPLRPKRSPVNIRDWVETWSYNTLTWRDPKEIVDRLAGPQ